MFYIEWELEVRVGLQETNNLFFYFTNNVGVSKSWVTATDGLPDLIDYSSEKKYFFEFFFSKNVFHACFFFIDWGFQETNNVF